MSAPPPPPLTPLEKASVFKESYTEALLFLKHQDDKINRVLTALAFLTAAGVTLYIFSRSQHTADFPKFANTYVRADDYFFASFLLGLFLSLAFALVALDPSSFAPRFFRKRADVPGSILFYGSIAQKSIVEWNELFDAPDLQEQLARNFHGDAHRLAHRAMHKVRRFSTANAVVQFTVAALALLGVMRLNQLRLDDRWWLATAVLIVYTALPLVEFLHFKFLDFPEVGSDYVERAWAEGAAFFLPYLGVAIAGLVSFPRQWQAVTFALIGTLVLRVMGSLRRRLLGNQLSLAIVLSWALALFGGIWLWCCS